MGQYTSLVHMLVNGHSRDSILSCFDRAEVHSMLSLQCSAPLCWSALTVATVPPPQRCFDHHLAPDGVELTYAHPVLHVHSCDLNC